ncbi:MAG: T9SS type A sorting domain-containing protein [Bacteroidia bacterium]
MHLFKNISISVIIAIAFSSAAIAQQLAGLSATLTQQETMLISWTMKAGSTCADLVLEHADESFHFSEIYYYPGICGNVDYEESYSYEQESRISRINYYRVKLGFEGYSDTIMTSAPLLGSSGIKIAPQPASSLVKFYFNNPLADKFTLRIVDLKGKEVFVKDGIDSNQIEIELNEFKNGIYFTSLSSPYKKYHSRLIIQH